MPLKCLVTLTSNSQLSYSRLVFKAVILFKGETPDFTSMQAVIITLSVMPWGVTHPLQTFGMKWL